MLKSEIRILGIDDAAFESKSNRKPSKRTTPVIGVVYRGGKFLDGVLRTDVTIDGMDATAKLVGLINNSRHKRQLRVVMLDGITLAGFNIVDIVKLHRATELPVLVVNRKMPNLTSVREALKNFKDYETRWQTIKRAGKVKKCKLKGDKDLYYQSIGLEDEEAEEVLLLSSTHGLLPEPLRVAHLIATAIVRGESYGRA